MERCPLCGVGLFRDHRGANRCMDTGNQHPCASDAPPLKVGDYCLSYPPCNRPGIDYVQQPNSVVL